MAVQRLSKGWFIVSAIVALVALFALGSSVTWFISLIEAPDTAGLAWLAFGAVLSSALLAVSVPILKSRSFPLWVRIAWPTFVGLFSVVAAVGVFFLVTVANPLCAGYCEPRDTWQLLPALLACGLLAASGPALGALVAPRFQETPFWLASAILGVIGFAVAMYAWVEVILFPLN